MRIGEQGKKRCEGGEESAGPCCVYLMSKGSSTVAEPQR